MNTNLAINTLTSNENNKKTINKTTKQTNDFADIFQVNVENKFDDIFAAAAKKYNVPINVLKAIAKAESNFNPLATSPAGAKGIMQLMPGTASAMGVTNVYDPEDNIFGGAKYFSQMLNLFDNDYKLALAAYNAGAGNVKKYKGIPPFAETQKYIPKVLAYAENYKSCPQESVNYAIKTPNPIQEPRIINTNLLGNNLDLNSILGITSTDNSDDYASMFSEQMIMTLLLNLALNTKTNIE